MVDLDGDQSYVISAGTCKGDSGGPVFVRSKFAAYCAVFLFLLKKYYFQGKSNPERFVLLGIASGGRSYVKECGGVNNPTIYVRMKKIGKQTRGRTLS